MQRLAETTIVPPSRPSRASPASRRRKVPHSEGPSDALVTDGRQGLPVVRPPGEHVADEVWLTIIRTFAAVFAGSVVALALAVFLHLTGTETILTVVMTVGGYLAGFLTPSPVQAHLQRANPLP
jgi:hypothetical protein